MGWEQLTSIQQQNREWQRQESKTPPETCPVCGHRLDVNARGERNCPFEHYRWRGGSPDTGRR